MTAFCMPGPARLARFAGALIAVTVPALAVPADPPAKAAPADSAYRSPYSVKFTVPAADLLAGIDNGTRGGPKHQSSVPFADWYSQGVRTQYGSWGPPVVHYPAPEKLGERSLAWKRERVVAVALRFQGYGYQHHHVPDWDPPEGWLWKETAVGHNGKGVDCSNFTSFVYNLAFGIKLNSDVKQQCQSLELAGPGEGHTMRAEHINLPGSYAGVLRTLRTGDLVYIRNKEGAISHVVIWVGSIGVVPDNAPLIIDSHGQGVNDSAGVGIPVGIHLRPFREKSWYFQSADHAHRIWREP